MRPVLIEWKGIQIHSYPAMLYLGLLIGIVAQNYAANLEGMDSWRVFVATLLLLVPALVGARLAWVLPRRSRYMRRPERIWDRSEGGAAMYGGLPPAILGSVPLLDVLGIPFWAFWDVATVLLLVGSIFTRIGCLLNGCCAGRSTSARLSLRLPDIDRVWRRRVPTRLLDAGWCGLLLVGVVLLWGRLPFPGALFLYGMGGYGAGRFLLEFTRERQQCLVGRLTINHLVSLALVGVSCALTLSWWPPGS